jgi:signal transduction histidine kinase
MEIKAKSKFFYITVGFFCSFILSLFGMVIEDVSHNVPLSTAYNSIHNFIYPFLIGILFAVFSFYYWKNKAQNFTIIENYTKNLNSLLDVNLALISTIDLDSTLQIIIDESTKLTNLDTGAIYLHKDEKLYLGATTPPLPSEFPDVLRYDLLANHPNIQLTLSTKKPTHIYDTGTVKLSDAEKSVVEFRGLKSILYVPLIIENRPIGTLILGTVNSLRYFSEDEIDMYLSFSSQAALAIENANLFKKSVIAANALKQQNYEYEALNEELKQINEELYYAKEKAEESDCLKDAFLKNLSHEIRTPMNAIIGFSDLLNKPDLSEEERSQFISYVQNSCYRLLEIVTDILTISSVETNQEKVSCKLVNVNQVIDQTITNFNKHGYNSNIVLRVKRPTLANSPEIYTDGTKLSQILNNLISNALKFTNEGFVEVGYTVNEKEFVFYVKDTGIGIKPEMHEKIFERFRQGDDIINSNYGGAGLGLAISKGFVELLDGKIWVVSDIQKGSTFFFTLPNSKPVLNESPISISERSVVSDTILVAEDEEYNFLYIQEVLRGVGAKILHAKNGDEAVTICKSNPNIGLVLMDIKMPIMDGNVATSLIKEFRPDLPIIAQSAYSMPYEVYKNNKKGFDGYLAKPISAEVLRSKIAEYL